MQTHAIKKRGKNLKSWLFYASLITLPLIQFCVMYLYVNFNSLVMAFRSYDMDTNSWSWVGFANFKSLFYDIKTLPELTYGFKNSLISWAVSLAISLPVSLFFAYYIFKGFRFSKAFRILLFVPSVISVSILTIIFKYYAETFMPQVLNGILGTRLRGFLSNKNTVFTTILFFNIFIGFGVSVLMYTGAMNGISESVIEAAKLDGVNTIQEFFCIVFPQIIGTVSVFLVTGIAGIFTNQLNLYSIFHSEAHARVYTIGYYLYRTIQQSTSYAQYPYCAALGSLVAVIVIPIILLVRWVLNKLDPLENWYA